MVTTDCGLTTVSKRVSVPPARPLAMSLFPMKVSNSTSLEWRCGMSVLEQPHLYSLAPCTGCIKRMPLCQRIYVLGRLISI